MTQTPGPGGASPDSVPGPACGFVPLENTKEIAMFNVLIPVLAALPSAGIPLGGTPLEQATQAFQAGEFAKVVTLAGAAKAEEADYPRLAYLAGEAELVLGAPAEAEKDFRGVLAQRPKAVP